MSIKIEDILILQNIETQNCSKQVLKYVDEICSLDKHKCLNFDVLESYPHTSALLTISWINVTLSFFITLAGIIIIYKIWIKEKNKLEGWPWKKEVYGISVKKFKCFGRSFVSFMLLAKLVPSLNMDVVDILTDTLYYHEIVRSCAMIDARMHTPEFVYIVLFIFMVIGMFKNIAVSKMAHRQLTKRIPPGDEDESDLNDLNGYMTITFFQDVLAFIFQDAVAAIIQYFYIEKFVDGYSFIAIANGIIMLVFSLRILRVFYKYIAQYWDKNDALKVKILHLLMLFSKLAVCIFHLMRTYAIVFSKWFNTEKELDSSCFSTEINHGLITVTQNPFSPSCLGKLGYTLIITTAVASIGTIACVTILFCIGFDEFKIFNQSHYSGRIGNITGTALPPKLRNPPPEGNAESIMIMHENITE